ncbi:MAG: hypothetical protein ACMUHM_09510 [Thermoplasmatota archaeon]
MADEGSRKDRGLFKDILRGFPKLLPFALSHHPDCPPYKADVIRIGKVRLCRGCTIAYGLALAIIAIYLLIEPVRDMFGVFSPFLIMGAGIFLGLFQIIRAVFRKMGVVGKSLIKIVLGIGISLILISIFELDLGFAVTYWTIIGLFLLYGVLGGALRFHYMKRTCEECEFKADLKECKGMSVVRELDK